MRILFFAHLKNAVGSSEVEITCNEVDADGLWKQLIQRFPCLARFRSAVRLARNSEYVGPEARFGETDEVALIPPVSGG